MEEKQPKKKKPAGPSEMEFAWNYFVRRVDYMEQARKLNPKAPYPSDAQLDRWSRTGSKSS